MTARKQHSRMLSNASTVNPLSVPPVRASPPMPEKPSYPILPFLGDADFSLAEDYEPRRQRDYRRRKCKTDEEGTPDQSAVVPYNLRLSERHPRTNCDYGNRDRGERC